MWVNSRLEKVSVSKCPQCLAPNVCKDKHFGDQSNNCVLRLVQTRMPLDPNVGVNRVTQKYVMGVGERN